MKQKHWQVSVFDKTSKTIKDDTFYTTDTEAYLVFELIDGGFTPDTATVTVYNVNGKATINVDVEVVDGIVRYEIPVEAIGHLGVWRTQVIFTKDGEDYTTSIIEFEVNGHLLDNNKPRLVAITNWNKFIKHARELIDDWEHLEEIRQTNEQQRELTESKRKSNESVRVANEAERLSKDSERNSKIENLEEQFKDVLDETTGKDVISAPEIILARGGYDNLSQRLLSTDKQLQQSEMFSGQADFVDMVKNRTKYSHMSAKKINAPYEALQVFCHDGSEHVTHEWKKNNNDDFWIYNVAYGGKITTSPEYLKSTDSKTGVWSSIDGSGNVYTTEVGASFTVQINGSTLQLNHMADSRGGIFRIVTDGDEANAVIVSTYSDTTVVKNTIIATGLSNSLHTVVGTFMGADPNHTPTSTARGWIRDDQTNHVSTDRYTMVGGLPFNGIYSSAVNKMLLGYGSNKEFAFNMTKNSEKHWFPEHNSQGTAFKSSEPVLIVDNQEFDFSNMEYDRLYSGVSLSFTQEVQCIFPSITNPLANMLISYEVGIDGVLSISGKMTFEQDVLVNNGYSLMMPLAWTTNNYVLDEIVTGIGTVSKNKNNNSNEQFVTESDSTYSFASIGGANKDYIAAMSIDYPNKTYRKGESGRGNPFIFFNHRPAYPKLYPLAMFAHNAKAGEVYQFYGQFAVGRIPRIYDLIK